MSLRATQTSHYDFHGLGITVSSDSEVATAIHSRLRQFPAGNQDPSALVFEYNTVAGIKDHVVERPRGRSRPVYEFSMGEVLYFEGTDCLYINYGDGVKALCNPAQGTVQLSLTYTKEENLWLASRPLFTLPLAELLKHRGLFALHAAGLCLNGEGLILPGASGAGKSTLTLALLRAGFDFLTDDTLFLAPADQGMRVLAFPDEIGIADATAYMFPELNYLRDLPKPPGSRKRQIHAEDVYEARTIWECAPSMIVCPKVADSDRSVIEPMSQDETLLELLPNVLLTEAVSSQAHLNALARLASGCECYRLQTGRDLDVIPALLRDLMN